MKRIYTAVLGIICTGMSIAQNGVLPNSSFENWQNQTLFDYTTQWGCSNIDEYRGVATTLKSTDAQLGTYSAELIAAEVGTAPDTAFGYVFHGSIGASGPDGGIAYTSQFNNVRFYYKCDIPATESANMIVIRYTGGVPDAPIMLPIASGTVSTWTQATIAVTAGTQTELFIGFIMGDPFSGVRPTPGSWLKVDNVQMYNNTTATTALPDPSFESWSSASTEEPTDWYTANAMLYGAGVSGVAKSTSVHGSYGSYSAELTTHQVPPVTGDTIPGVISLGTINFYDPSNPFSAVPYVAVPSNMTVVYSYSGVSGDQGSIQAIFYQMGNPVGVANQTCMSTMGFSVVNIPIMFGGTPDSIRVVGFSGMKPGSKLFIDALQLSGGNVGLDDFAKFDVNLYPNPATSSFMIKMEGSYSYELIDLSGNVILQAIGVNGPQQIDVSTISRGSYLVRLTNDVASEILPLVVE